VGGAGGWEVGSKTLTLPPTRFTRMTRIPLACRTREVGAVSKATRQAATSTVAPPASG
jgi:hypothetical protein